MGQEKPHVSQDMDARERLLNSALRLAVTDGWRATPLAAIAADADVPLPDAYAAFPTRLAILCGLLRRTDRRVLEDGPADRADRPKDRLFEILMRRFDAMTADKAGAEAIMRDLPFDPLTSLMLAPGFANSMSWMLEAAGLSPNGIGGTLRVKGLALVYLATFRVWLDDDSVDMAKTMAALDRYLNRAESIAGCLPTRSRRGGREDKPSDQRPEPDSPPAAVI